MTVSKQVAYEMDKAIYEATNGVKGPVWIDIPLDIQSANIEPNELPRFTPHAKQIFDDFSDIEYAASTLNHAKRPVILIGSGVRSSGAVEELRELIDLSQIPIVFAHSAVDVFSYDNELSIGAVGGIYGTRAGNFAVQNCDLLLVIGCRLTTMTTGADKNKFVRNGKIVVVDINSNEFSKNTANIERIIVSDAKRFLEELLKQPLKQASQAWVQKCRHWKEVFPRCEAWARGTKETDLYFLAEVLSDILPDESVLVVDAGLEELILPSNITFKYGMRCIQPTMQGSMGFALPGAIGAHYACGKPICAVIGDGSVMMNLQELTTVAYRKIPLKLFIVNNNMYAVIRKRQRNLFRTRIIGTDSESGVGITDFKKIAECFGIKYFLVSDSENLANVVSDVFAHEGAVICEIIGKADQVYLEQGYARTREKKYVRRPIEDQSPFMDRNLFLSEMISEPIDQ